jgi:esterase/lipase
MSLHKKLHLFENGYHELQHDEEKDELLERAFQFLNEIPNSMIK